MARILSFFSILFILLSSCDESGNYQLASSGLSGEVVVVMEDEYWSGPLGDSVRAYFENSVPGLPQQEYMFNVGQYNHHKFTKILKTHRNVVLFEIDPKNSKQKIEYLQNVYATNQVVVKIVSPGPREASEIFKDEVTKIINLINNRERDRLIDKHKTIASKNISETLKSKHNINLIIPDDCQLAEDKGNFIWIKRDRVKYVSGEAHDVDEGVLIYYYPYTDDSTFTLEYLLAKRDSVLQKNVPGPNDGSYMATERDSSYYPFFIHSQIGEKQYAAEIRGLYKTVNDYYGGPFISLSTFDEKRSRIVTIDCYVFAPKFHKREYIREMEAICYSLSFPE